MSETVRYFAELDDSNIVVRIILADQEFINSGVVGDAQKWVESFVPFTYESPVPRGRPAVVGGSYDQETDEFKDNPSVAVELATKKALGEQAEAEGMGYTQ
jgi:hypothetical protein